MRGTALLRGECSRAQWFWCAASCVNKHARMKIRVTSLNKAAAPVPQEVPAAAAAFGVGQAPGLRPEHSSAEAAAGAAPEHHVANVVTLPQPSMSTPTRLRIRPSPKVRSDFSHSATSTPYDVDATDLESSDVSCFNAFATSSWKGAQSVTQWMNSAWIDVRRRVRSTHTRAKQVGYIQAYFSLLKSICLALVSSVRRVYNEHPQRVALGFIAFPFLLAVLLYALETVGILSSAPVNSRSSMTSLGLEHRIGPDFAAVSSSLSSLSSEQSGTPESPLLLQEKSLEHVHRWRDSLLRRGAAYRHTQQDSPAIEEHETVALVAACQNAEHTFHMASMSWFYAHGIAEFVIVDWSSSRAELMRSTVANEFVSLPPVQRDKLLFVRVLDEPNWSLTRAYNLAFGLVRSKRILKVDCDTILSVDFVEKNPLPSDTFVTGVLGTFRNENEEALRGVFLARTGDVLQLGGYDERLHRYGHEQDDLYSRMKGELGLSEVPIDLDTVTHILPDDKAMLLDMDPRALNDVGDTSAVSGQSKAAQSSSSRARLRARAPLLWQQLSPRVSSRFNMMALKEVEAWRSTSEASKSVYKYLLRLAPQVHEHTADDAFEQPDVSLKRHRAVDTASLHLDGLDNELVVRATRRAQAISATLNETVEASLLRHVYEIVLHDEYAVPWDVLVQLEIASIAQLDSGIRQIPTGKLVFIVLNGVIADRLAGLAFALGVALTYDRGLVVVWEGGYLPPDVDARGRVRFDDVVDAEKTNKRLEQDGLSTRIVGLDRWKCESSVDMCIQWDKAYAQFDEFWIDALDGELPVAPRRHLLLRMYSWSRQSSQFVSELLLREIQEAFRVMSWSPDIRITVAAEDELGRKTGLYFGNPATEVEDFVAALRAKRGPVLRLRNGKKRYVVAASDLRAARALHDKLYTPEADMMRPLGSEMSRVPCDSLVSSEDPTALLLSTNHLLRVACTKLQVANAIIVGSCSTIFPASGEDERLVDVPGIQATADLQRFLASPV
ncbi:hypothetical protein FVE85_7089 [Porphyridium purpureum]|uniref:Uncharacterized protein n=1 Tax=Porphyridium purpureum TaxID=35688 RepID=A0A5J4Z944_PORPP|nr:hypothetical protein FVE85_7089 [Porphyridium purpureum]|eukprot:POR3193..scf295_1